MVCVTSSLLLLGCLCDVYVTSSLLLLGCLCGVFDQQSAVTGVSVWCM